MHIPDLAGDEQVGEVIHTVTLQPREDKEVFIGVYEEGLQEPQLKVEISPRNSEKVKYELLRFDVGDEYKLIYYFQNLTYHTCHATIREKSYVGGMYVS